jgi:hypothetical protein
MDSLEAHFLNPAQCQARAELVRCTAKATANFDLRQHLLEIAAQYEHLAVSAERASSSAVPSMLA